MLPLINPRTLSATSKLIKLTVSRSIISCKTVECNDHIFKKLWTKQELIEHLCSNVHYEDENYIVLNKPYGVRSRFNKDKVEMHVKEGAACESALTDILPDLSARFEVEDLKIVVNPEMLFSGVTLLTKNRDSDTGILKTFNKIPYTNRTFSFLTVVLNTPPTSVKEEFRLSFNKVQNCHEILKKIGKKSAKSLKKLTQSRVGYSHEVLFSSEHASLVKVDLDSNYLTCLRVVLAMEYFTPVLGDADYTPRVTTLFGVPLLAPPTTSLSTRKILSPEILNLLQLSPEDIDCCPCHVHLYSMMFKVKEKRFVASVPPPEYFVFTCERLGLDVTRFLKGFQYSPECRQACANS